jgi:NTP pyrophosphatase (non-canonical NTP hydrolase)
MNRLEHLLACLAEESCEIAKEAHKAQRFTIDDRVTLDPHGPRGTTGPTTRDKIVDELNDLMGVVSMLVAEGALPADWYRVDHQARKMKRVEAYMVYAQRVGALEVPGE